ncbi:MAG: hypothetical protein ACM3VS_02925 [Candidatus Dadabacteria bacterium]
MPLFLFPKVISPTASDAGLFHLFIDGINSSGVDHAFLASFFSLILLFIQAFIINYVMNEYRMNTKQTYLPAMAYLLITSLLPEWNYLSAPLLASTLVIWAFSKLFKMYNLGNANGELYNTGLILGISSYVYFPSTAFVLCIIIGLMILKAFRLNEILLIILGVITPYYFYASYLFLSSSFSIPKFLPGVFLSVPGVKSSIYIALTTFLLGMPFLIGGFYVQKNLHKMLIQVRKNWSILLLYVVISFFVPFVNTTSTFVNWVLMAAPFAAFHACAYYFPIRKFMPNLLFFITAGYIIYNQYFTHFWR